MNMTIGLAGAKAHLSEFIDRVEAGETIIIAGNGQPVAQVRPVETLSPAETVQRIREIGQRVAQRNQGKPAWPKSGELRGIAHEGHRR